PEINNGHVDALLSTQQEVGSLALDAVMQEQEGQEREALIIPLVQDYRNHPQVQIYLKRLQNTNGIEAASERRIKSGYGVYFTLVDRYPHQTEEQRNALFVKIDEAVVELQEGNQDIDTIVGLVTTHEEIYHCNQRLVIQ